MAAPTARYEVRIRIQDSGAAWRVHSFPADSTVVTIPGLSRGVNYEGEARAVGYSGEASIWVPVTFSVGMPSYVPKPPINMVVLPSPNGVTVRWEVGDGNRPDTVYEVWNRPPGGDWALVGETPGTSMYVPLPDDQDYEWKVLAKNFQEAMSNFTDAVTRARQHVADQIDLANEIEDRIQGDADEAAARAAGDAAEALARSAALLDQKIELTADINNEKILREAGDDNLAAQIASISAGSGEQFDSEVIWYYNTDSEGWTAVTGAAPTVTDGYMRPANGTGTGGVQSPVFDGNNGETYRTVKLRMRRVGDPVWQGYVWWQTESDPTYTSGKRVAADEPGWDLSDVATLTVNDIPWDADVSRIRVDINNEQSATDYYEFDWIAVGRPSPGASMAALQEEQIARITGDQAEAAARLSLASQMRGNYTGNNLALVTQGLLADEKSARTTADSAEVTARQALSTKVTGLADPSGATLPTLSSGLIYDERTARSTADSALASDITALDVRLDVAEGDITAQGSALSLLETQVTDIAGVVESNSSAITDLNSAVDAVEAGVAGNSSAISGLNTRMTAAEGNISSQSSQITSLSAAITTTIDQMNNSGGDNILQNSSFDGEQIANSIGLRPKYWTTQGGGTGTGTGIAASFVDSPLQGSTKAVRMVATALAATRYVELVANIPELPGGVAYKVTPGRKHTLSAWIRGKAGNSIQMYVQYRNSGGVVVQTNTLPSTPVTETFTKYSVVGNPAPVTAVTANVYAVRMFGNVTESDAWVEVDNVMFQVGDFAGDYQPGVAVTTTANASAISALDARTTANEASITSQASQITTLQTQIGNANPNTMPNPSGELGTVGWTQGSPSIGVNTNTAYGTYYYVQSVTSATVHYYELAAGAGTYTISMDGFVPASQAGFSFDAICTDVGGTPLLDSANTSFVAGDSFVRKNLTFVAPAATAKISIRIVSAGTNTEIRWRRIKFELGSIATPFSDEATSKATAGATQSLDARVTSTESGVTSNSASITSLNSSVSNLNNARPNMWKNPSGEANLDGWVTHVGPALTRVPKSPVGPYVYATGVTATSIYTVDMKDMGIWAPGRDYTVSFEMNHDVAAGVNVYVESWTDTTYLVSTPNISRPPGDWTRHIITFTPPAGTTWFRLQIRPAGTGTFNIRRVKVETGNTFSPDASEGLVNFTANATQTLETNVKAGAGGSGNLFPNSQWQVDTAPGFAIIWAPAGGSIGLYRATGDTDGGVPKNVNAQITTCNNGNGDVVLVSTATLARMPGIKIKPGSWYIFSIYASGYRTGVWVQWQNTSGAVIGEYYQPDIPTSGGGPLLSDQTRVFAKLQAPAGAAYVRLGWYLRSQPGQFAFQRVMLPMFEEVNAFQTTPSIFGTSGVEMFAAYTVALDVNGYASGFQSYNNGTSSNFTILADYFVVAKPGGGARLEWSGGNQRVYDGAGVLRVRMGVW